TPGLLLPSVGDGDLSRDNRPRAWQAAKTSKVTEERENGNENYQLRAVSGARLREHLPHQPERGLRPAHGPHGSVEVAALAAFALGRRLDARELSERTKDPGRCGERIVRVKVDLLQMPVTGNNDVDVAGDVQHCERDHLAP